MSRPSSPAASSAASSSSSAESDYPTFDYTNYAEFQRFLTFVMESNHPAAEELVEHWCADFAEFAVSPVPSRALPFFY